MLRSLTLYLDDIQDAIRDIQEFTRGKSLENYLDDDLLNSAVERKFSIIGEAMAQIRHHFPTQTGRVEHTRQIIDFRNLLMHRYHEVDDKLVWGVIKGSLEPFAAEVQRWKAETTP